MPPNSFCVDPPTGVRPVYDGLIIEFPPFQLSTKTPEELLAQPDFAAVWRPGGDITSDHIQEFMSVVTSAHLRADPTCYGDLPSRWHLPSTFVGEQRPLNAPPTIAESRTIEVALDGHTLSFRFWRDIHLPHIGRSALYYFSHECLDDPTFCYEVYRWSDDGRGSWLKYHDVCNATSTSRIMILAKESKSRVYLPYAPKIVLDWVDTALTIY